MTKRKPVDLALFIAFVRALYWSCESDQDSNMSMCQVGSSSDRIYVFRLVNGLAQFRVFQYQFHTLGHQGTDTKQMPFDSLRFRKPQKVKFIPLSPFSSPVIPRSIASKVGSFTRYTQGKINPQQLQTTIATNRRNVA